MNRHRKFQVLLSMGIVACWAVSHIDPQLALAVSSFTSLAWIWEN